MTAEQFLTGYSAADSMYDDERVLRDQFQSAAENVFARLWDNEDDEVWSEYL